MGDNRLPRAEASPFYKLPSPPTNPELIAAVMISEAHLKASELGVDLGERLVDCLYWCDEPEMRALRFADGGPGDSASRAIAEAMVRAGRAAAQRLGYAGGFRAGLRKLEMSPCPTCARPFQPERNIVDGAGIRGADIPGGGEDL